jgi:outer membrane protein OmpA-like peptidoglycan-associated protein
MKMRYLILTLCLVVAASSAFAQSKSKENAEKDKKETSEKETDIENLVPNGGFEAEEVKGLKMTGQLSTFCKEWVGPNKTSADLFHVHSKSTKSGAPANDYGAQEPMNDGQAYAGFRAYTKDPKNTRTYMQVKLNKKLEQNKLYCVRYSLSLAEISKFGVNNVGIFISDRKLTNAEDNAINLSPQILEKTNKAITTTDGWETICTTFIGSGKEEYIIIGGFGAEDKMKLEKVKKQAGGIMQGNEAYYYVDNVEIFEVEAGSQCTCSKEDGYSPDLIYSRASAKAPNMKPTQIVESSNVYFAALDGAIPTQFHKELDEIAAILMSSPQMKLEITGHSDTDEMNEAKLKPVLKDMAMKRAEAVKKYLVDKGIGEQRITTVSKDNTMPASTKPSDISKAQNRRVEFKIS